MGNNPSRVSPQPGGAPSTGLVPNSELEALRRELQHSQRQHDKDREALSLLGQQLEQAKAERQRLEQAVQAARAEVQRAGQQGGLLSQREARLAAQCEQLQQQLATQLAAGAGSAAASEAQQRAAALAAELQQTKAAYAELKVQGDRLFERSREEIKKRTDRIRELKAEAQSGAEAQAQLRAQVEQLTAANAVAQRELLSLQAHLQEAQDGTAKLRAAVEEREKVVEGLRAQVAAAVEAAPAATGQHEEEIRQLQQQLAAVTAGSANVRSLGAEQQGSVEQLSEKLAEAEARLMAAEEDAQTAAARCAELERQLAEERRVAAAWQADLKDRLQQSESRLDEAVRLLQEQQQSQAEAGPSGSGPPLADNAFPESAAGFVLVAYDIENVRPPIGIGLNSILGYIRREFIGEGKLEYKVVTSLSQYVLKVYSEQLGRNFLVNALLDMTLLLNCSRADAARGASPHRHHAAGVPQEIKNVDADTLLQKEVDLFIQAFGFSAATRQPPRQHSIVFITGDGDFREQVKRAIAYGFEVHLLYGDNVNKAQLERWDNPKIRSRQPWRNFLARHSGRPADSITFPDFDAPPPGRQQPRPSPSSSAGRQRLYPDHQRGGTPVSGGRAASAAAGASSSPAGTLAADDGSLTPHNSGGHAKDLNAVGMKALCMVEGIGKGTAKRVLTSRPFSDWDDFVVTMARQGVTSVQLLALRQAGFVVGSSSAVIAGGSASSSSRLTPPAYSPASPSELESGPQRNGGGSARGGGRWRHRQQQSGPGRRQRMYGDAAGERSPGSGGESHAATPGAGPPMSSP